MTTPPATPGQWKRLHPLTPVVRAGRIVSVLVVALVISDAHGRSDNSAGLYDLALVIVVVLAGAVRWIVTRWMLDGGTLRIESGLLRRDSRQLPLARIQAVDVVRPFLARVFGLSELRIRLAGSASANGRLAYLSHHVATDLRARLLATHHGIDPDTPEPAEQLVTTVPAGRLIGSVLLSGGITFVPSIIALVILVRVSSTAAVVFGGAFATYLIGFVQGVWRRISAQYGFAVADAPDGIRIRRGLLGTVAETIPVRRVQAVRLIEPFTWRLFRWCRLEVDVAGAAGREERSGRTATSTKALLPVGSHDVARQLLATVIRQPQPATSPPPARTRLKAPLSYHFLAAGHNDVLVMATTGRVRRTTTWVPMVKAQSIRRIQGPLQRRLGLATVHLDAAGKRVRAEFRDRDADEADRLIDDLTSLSRAARKREDVAPGSATPAATASAGWFPDPVGRHQLRYWDGSDWTGHVRDHEVVGLDPP
ncbi:MAG TPA: PH domain-containing protein [Acidimicrobiales bacterium]|nr:PH domain-containing protein [Acidimicrobiales bacterium]